MDDFFIKNHARTALAMDQKKEIEKQNTTHGPQTETEYGEFLRRSCDSATGPFGEGGGCKDVEMKGDGDSLRNADVFPVTHLYELETRVFQDNWSIPYKRDESLGKCLVAAEKLAREGLLEQDDHCKKFLERIMPEAFRKLLTSQKLTLKIKVW